VEAAGGFAVGFVPATRTDLATAADAVVAFFFGAVFGATFFAALSAGLCRSGTKTS
jgi:hypothetical protein